VTNVINLSVPWVLQPVAAGGGLTLRVAASYEVKGPRTLALAFEWARVGELRISDLLQGLLAPAVLPRTPLQHELLMRLQEAALEVRACLRVGPVGSVKPRSCVTKRVFLLVGRWGQRVPITCLGFGLGGLPADEWLCGCQRHGRALEAEAWVYAYPVLSVCRCRFGAKG